MYAIVSYLTIVENRPLRGNSLHQYSIHDRCWLSPRSAFYVKSQEERSSSLATEALCYFPVQKKRNSSWTKILTTQEAWLPATRCEYRMFVFFTLCAFREDLRGHLRRTNLTSCIAVYGFLTTYGPTIEANIMHTVAR